MLHYNVDKVWSEHVRFYNNTSIMSFNVLVETVGATDKIKIVIINLLNIFEWINVVRTTRAFVRHSSSLGSST